MRPLIDPADVKDWEDDCLKWRGRVLSGEKAHWCYDWDFLPIDETTPEWPCNCVFADPTPAKKGEHRE